MLRVPHASSLPRRAAILVALALAAASLALAGCLHGGGGDADADPAKVAPRNTLIWLSAQVRPEGDQREAVESIARKVLRTDDPQRRVRDLLNRAFRESDSRFTYQDDVEPWLGRRAGVAVTSFGGGGRDAQAVAIFAAKDTDAARSAVDKLADEETPRPTTREYEDVEYRFDASDRTAAGVIDNYLVVGNEAAFRATVDASKGEGLTDNERFSQAIGDAEDKLGYGYVDTRAVVGALGAQGQIPGGAQGLQSLLGSANEPVTMTLDAAPQRITLETSARAARGQARQPRPNAVVPRLPGDSWLALGLPNLGQTLRQTIDQLGSGVGAGIVETLQQQIRAQTGLDLNRDILASLGELAVFAQGSSVLTAGGGVVIATPDPAAARRVLDRLGPLVARQAGPNVSVGEANVGGARGVRFSIQGVPGAVNAVVRGDRMVIAYTDAATREALNPRRPLSDSPEFQQAARSLGGGQPSLYVALEPLSQLIAAASPDSADQIRQYMGAFSNVVAGSRVQGNRQIARVVVNLK